MSAAQWMDTLPTDDVLLLSPHSDDVALSLGGALPPAFGPDSWLLTVFNRTTFLSPSSIGVEGEVSRLRELEDVTFASALGLKLLCGDLADAAIRGPSKGDPFWRRQPSVSELAGPLALLQELTTDLGPTLVVGPLGIGGHVDHLIVRRIAETVATSTGVKLALYEDLPYALDEGHSSSLTGGLEPVLLAVDAAERSCSVRSYPSQKRLWREGEVCSYQATSDGRALRIWVPGGRQPSSAAELVHEGPHVFR